MARSARQAHTKAVVVVTCGASGIGESVARHYAVNGARVVVLDVDAKRGVRLAHSLADRLLFLTCDVSESARVATAFQEIGRRYNHIDVLVNNVAVQEYKSVADCSEELWDRIMAVNVKSYFLCAKQALPWLRRARAPVIVNMASANSFVAMRNAAAYVTSKAAILGLTRSLAVDCAPWLRCVAVCPGAVHTPALRRDFARVPASQRADVVAETKAIHLTNRITSPEEVAAFVEFIASPRAPSATGQAYRIDGGIGVCVEGT